MADRTSIWEINETGKTVGTVIRQQSAKFLEKIWRTQRYWHPTLKKWIRRVGPPTWRFPNLMGDEVVHLVHFESLRLWSVLFYFLGFSRTPGTGYASCSGEIPLTLLTIVMPRLQPLNPRMGNSKKGDSIHSRGALDVLISLPLLIHLSPILWFQWNFRVEQEPYIDNRLPRYPLDATSLVTQANFSRL